jgi:hypothetical protein
MWERVPFSFLRFQILNFSISRAPQLKVAHRKSRCSNSCDKLKPCGMKQKYKERFVKTPQMGAECGLSKGTQRELSRKCGENLGFPRSFGVAAKAFAVQGLRLGCSPEVFRRSTPVFLGGPIHGLDGLGQAFSCAWQGLLQWEIRRGDNMQGKLGRNWQTRLDRTGKRMDFFS